MKKLIKGIGAVFLATILLAITGCLKTSEYVENIQIVDEGYQKEYHYGETLNLTGVKLRIIKTEGEQIINVTFDMIDDADLTTPGHKSIVVRYHSCTTSFEVLVLGDVKVTFALDSGNVYETQELLKGTTAVSPSTPTKTGYTFTGWYLNDQLFDFDTPIETSITLVAKFAANKYQVTFDANGGNFTTGEKVIQEITYPNHPSIVDAPTRTGYTFRGWFVDNEEFDFSKIVLSDVTVVAKWDINHYDVTFNSNGGTNVDNQNVAYNEKVQEPTNPTKTGYVFKGWYLNDVLYDFTKEVTEDLNLTAKWEKEIYTVTIESGIGTFKDETTKKMQKVAFEETLKDVETPTKTGYKFTGWYQNDKAFDLTTPIREDITITAHFEKEIYTVAIESGIGTFKDETTKKTQKVAFEETLKDVETPTKTGYTFTGWYQNEKAFDLTTPITGDITITAHFEKEIYTVTFRSGTGTFKDETTKKTQKVAFEETLKDVESPTKTGYDFIEWQLDGEKFDLTTPITENIVLDAYFEIHKYNVKFYDKDNEVLVSLEVPYLTDAKAPDENDPKLQKEGYHFVKWSKEYTSVTSDLDIYPEYEINTYEVTFYNEKGQVIATQTINHGENIKALSVNLEKTGYAFKGFVHKDKEEEPITDITKVKVTEALEFVTVYELIAPTVTINGTDGEEPISDNKVEREFVHGQNVILTVFVAHALLTTDNVTYQWYKDGEIIAEQTNNRIIITNVKDSGTYYCKITLHVGEETVIVQSDSIEIIINLIQQEIQNIKESIVLPAFENYTDGSNVSNLLLQEANRNLAQRFGANVVLKYNYTSIREPNYAYNQKVKFRVNGEEATTLPGPGFYNIEIYVEENEIYTAASYEFTILLYTVEVYQDASPKDVKFFSSIEDAVNNSQNGDHILIVGPTILNNNVVLDKGQTIEIKYSYPNSIWNMQPNFSDFPFIDGYSSDGYFNTVKGTGSITLEKGAKIIEPMFFNVCSDTAVGTKFSGLKDVLTEYSTKGTYPKDFPFFPFDSYSIHNFQVDIIIEYGAEYGIIPVFGVDITMLSPQGKGLYLSLPKDNCAEAVIPSLVVPYDGAETEGLIALKEGAKFTKHYIRDEVNRTEKTIIDLEGDVITGNFPISLILKDQFFTFANFAGVPRPTKVPVNIDIETVPFELMSNVEINLNNATLTVNRDVILKTDSIIKVNGTSKLIINNNFTGKIFVDEKATVEFGKDVNLGMIGDVVVETFSDANIIVAKDSIYTPHLQVSIDGKNIYEFYSKYTIKFAEVDGVTKDDVVATYDDELKLSDPTRKGYLFKGWFLDKACTVPFNFNKMPELLSADFVEYYDAATRSVTLYPCWELEDPVVDTLSFGEVEYDGKDHKIEVFVTPTIGSVTVKKYQWYKVDADNVGKEIVGQNDKQLFLRNTKDSGTYYCAVTIEDKEGHTKTVYTSRIRVVISGVQIETDSIKWTGLNAEYNYQDQSSTVKATYPDVNGKEIECKLTFEKTDDLLVNQGVVKFLYPGTYKVTAIIEDENYQADNITETANMSAQYVAKIKDTDTQYYTIEEAIKKATAGQTIILLKETKFVDPAITLEDTFDLVANLLLPYKADDTTGNNGTNQAEYASPTKYLTLTIPQNITLNVSGDLTIGAQTGKWGDANNDQNAISGGYSELKLEGKIVSTGNIYCYGYIKGNGSIDAQSGLVQDLFVIHNWRGGSNAAGVYTGGASIFDLFGGEVANPNIFPFNEYTVRNIETGLKIGYGARYVGNVKIYTSTPLQQFNEVNLGLIGSDGTLITLLDKDAYVEKTLLSDRSTLKIYGNVKDGSTAMKLNAIVAEVTVDTNSVLFPINGVMDLILMSGSKMSISNKYKFLPGANFTISEGAQLTLEDSAQVIFYQQFDDKGLNANGSYKYPVGREAAKLVNDGTLTINGTFGGVVSSTTKGKIIVGDKAVLTISSKEGYGTRSGMDFTWNETSNITEVAKASQVGTDSITLEVGKTYNYDGKSWVAEA